MIPLTPAELLVRASMDLRGFRPSLAQLDAVEADPSTYAAFVEEYLHSPEFLERVKDVFDDALLVRREDFTDEARDKTWAIYGEALELIAWIVDHDRPFTEIGTADYTVANQLFQSDPNRMPFPMEPVVGPTWQPTHYTDGRPHAGPPLDQCVLRGLGHEQHEQEPAAREPLVDRVSLLQLPRHAGRRDPQRRQQRRRRGPERGDDAARLPRLPRPPGSDGVVPLPARQHAAPRGRRAR
jgi:hypothetical protein